MESNFQNTSNNLKEEEEEEEEILKSKKRKLNDEEEEEEEEEEAEIDNNSDDCNDDTNGNEDNESDDDDQEEDKNQLDDQLLLNILNHLMKNKIQEKKSFVSQLSNFLDSDHDERGEFIKKNQFFIPKIRRLCLAILSKKIDIPLRHYERQIIKDIGKKQLHKHDEMITLVENLTFHRVLRKARTFLLQSKKK